MKRNCLIHYNTGSVEGSSVQYLVGQYGVVLAGTWWYWVSILLGFKWNWVSTRLVCLYILKKVDIWSDVTIAGRTTKQKGKIELLSQWTMDG